MENRYGYLTNMLPIPVGNFLTWSTYSTQMLDWHYRKVKYFDLIW